MASLPITEEELAVDAEQAKELSTSMENSAELKTDFSTLKGKLPWPVKGGWHRNLAVREQRVRGMAC